MSLRDKVRAVFFLVAFMLPVLHASDPLFFYHIRKSGGTSVVSLISQKFHDREIIGGFQSKKIVGRDFDPSNYAFIWTHIPFSHGFQICPQGKNITFLRDPVERVLSNYRYNLLCTGKYQEFELFYRSYNNLQVRTLTSLNWKDPSISLEAHLNSAKENLQNHFFFVGITERMEESLCAFYKMMGWAPLTTIPVLNITHRPDYSEEFLEYLKQEEWADRELYHFANALLDVSVEKTQGVIVEPKQLPLVERVDFTFADPFEGEGWGYREYEGDRVYRSSYRQNATLDFPLNPDKSYVLKFAARLYVSGLELYVNGHQVHLTTKSNGHWTEFEAHIPKDFLDASPMQLEFRVPSLYTPICQNPKDSRSLGVALSEISIFPIEGKEEVKAFVSGHLSNWMGWCTEEKAHVLIDLILDHSPKVCVEIGVFGGSSLFPMAYTLKSLGEGTVYAIDPWDNEECIKHTQEEDPNYAWWCNVDLEMVYDCFCQNVNDYQLNDQCIVLRQPSVVASDVLPDAIDLLHIDGNHAEASSFQDALLYLPKVRPGGHIVFDDINWCDVNGHCTTKRALDHLLTECTVVKEFDTFIVLKKSSG